MDNIEDEINDKKRVCHICQKAFDTGKALGGHMRIHVQPPNKKDKKQKPDCMIETLTCYICGNFFKSTKSLSGHMRSHPERNWRGIRPPSSMAINTSSSASLSDTVPPKSDDQIGVSDSMVDLTQSLMRWPVTAIRGRKATVEASSSDQVSSSADNQLWIVANSLLMLSRGHRDHSFEINVHSESKIEDVEAVVVATSDDVVLGESVMNNLSDDDEMDDSAEMEELNETDLESRKTKVMVKSKKKRKKMKLSDLQSSEIAIATPMPAKYRHDQTSSGHNISASDSVEMSKTTSQKGLLIDLNEEPPNDISSWHESW